MDTARVFVGCLLDLVTSRRVVDMQRVVRKSVESAGWRAAWVPPPNLHLTLKFVGDVDVGLVDPLASALASVARAHAPLSLAIGDVGRFPERGPPSVLFAAVGEGHGALAALARAVDDAFAALGLPREARAFHGHVTLARVREIPAGSPPLEQVLPSGGLTAGVGLVRDVTLYRSDLLRQGVEYHVLARAPLGGDASR